jgi:hypothetical protein
MKNKQQKTEEKKGRGRPKTIGGDCMVCLRLPIKMKVDIEILCRDRGISISDYIRSVLS